MKDAVSLDQYEAMTDDQLFEELGRHLLGSGPGMLPDERREARNFGRRWFENQRERLSLAICSHPKVKGFRGNTTSDNLLESATIYSIVAGGTLGDPLQAAIVSVMAARIGLSTFCANVPLEP